MRDNFNFILLKYSIINSFDFEAACKTKHKVVHKIKNIALGQFLTFIFHFYAKRGSLPRFACFCTVE